MLVGADSLSSLTTVFIVDADQLVSTVRQIITTVEPGASYAASPSHVPSGVALPLETEGQLACTIVLARELLETLTSERFHPFEAVSTVLEELLHVWVYEAAWRRRGYVQHRGRGLSGCEADVLTIVSQMCDEYVVIRRKTELASTWSLFDSQPGPGLVVGKLEYGSSVVDTVAAGTQQIVATVIEAASGQRAPSDSWACLVSVLYRGIFEPLARHAAYNDVAASSQTIEGLNTIRLYREVIAAHWSSIHGGLKRVFASSLEETETVLAANSDTIRRLLLIMGVSYQRMPNGSCWVDFQVPDREAG